MLPFLLRTTLRPTYATFSTPRRAQGAGNAPFHHTPGEWYVDGELNKGV